MNDFVFWNPTKIIFGKDSMTQIAENIRPLGRKVLLTYGKGSIKKNGVYNKVKEQLTGFEVEEFSGIEPNPRVETVRLCLKQYKGYKPDFLLAVGGGSVIDATKLLASSWYYDGDPWDFLTSKSTKSKRYLPLGVVLTIPATGSEMNSGAVISRWETHEKPFFDRNEIYPKFSILDPQNTFSLPADQTAYGIVDAFSHVLEQYLHTTQNVPLQDRFSEGILLTLIENAPVVLKEPKNYNARANIMLAAAMALNNLISSGVNQDWATHGVEHEFSAIYDIPHGAGLAIITPRWMEAVFPQKVKKLAHYGRRVWNLEGKDPEVAKKAIKKTYDFFASLGIRMSLAEWNIDNSHFPKISKKLVTDKIGETPLSKKQIDQVLVNCLELQKFG